MKIANRMMIGSGIPISQSSNPRPNPMTNLPDLFVGLFNAAMRREFHRDDGGG
jgi:hypothetical protein